VNGVKLFNFLQQSINILSDDSSMLSCTMLITMRVMVGSWQAWQTHNVRSSATLQIRLDQSSDWYVFMATMTKKKNSATDWVAHDNGDPPSNSIIVGTFEVWVTGLSTFLYCISVFCRCVWCLCWDSSSSLSPECLMREHRFSLS